MEVLSDDEIEQSLVENDYQETLNKLDELIKECSVEVSSEEKNGTNNVNTINYPPKILHKDINYHSQQCETGTIYICLYQINNFSKFPFLQYFMLKYAENHRMYSNMLVFPNFNYIRGQDVFKSAQTIVDFICLCYRANMKYSYNGFIQEEDNFYMMFDFSETAISSYIIRKNDDLWLVGMDEIINHNKVMNYNICSDVVDFFMNHKEMIYITNNNGEKYETPLILYNHCPNKMLDFSISFGCPRMAENHLLGPYFYFMPFKNAQEFNDATINNRDGLIRNAVFIGNSSIAHNLAPQTNISSTFKAYDSMCINNAGLIYWIIDEYDNQVPISGHPDIIDK
jgi:hypothetical protein